MGRQTVDADTVEYYSHLLGRLDWDSTPDDIGAVELIGGPYDGMLFPYLESPQCTGLFLPSRLQQPDAADDAIYALYDRTDRGAVFAGYGQPDEDAVNLS